MADIITSAIDAGNFKRLLQAVEKTELEETLKSSDSLTIFAPTDEAFENLSEETLNILSEDNEKLKRVVAYHIGFGDVRAEDLLEIEEIPTMEGSIIAVDTSSGKIKLNDANVITTDLIVDNGVIHVIDKVLIPGILLNE